MILALVAAAVAVFMFGYIAGHENGRRVGHLNGRAEVLREQRGRR